MNEKYSELLILLFSYVLAYIGGIFFYSLISEYDFFPEILNSENNKILFKIFLSNIISTIIIWLIGIYYNTASLYDPYWSVQTPIIHLSLFLYKTKINIGNLLYILFILIWSIRLTLNFIKSFNNISYIDWRYQLIKQNTGKFYQLINLVGICIVPTIIVYIASIPSYLYLLNNYEFSFSDIFGYIIILISVYIEMKADLDMLEYKKLRKNKNEIINKGLWKFSRHPNYFGEICFWYGVALVWILRDLKNNLIGGIGAVLVNLLFLGISIPLAETHLMAYKKGYEKYKQSTNMLIPFKL